MIDSMQNEDFQNSRNVRIPKRRMEILESSIKEIEKRGRVKLEITDSITIKGEPFDVFIVSNVITAIGRGFDYSEASLIFDDYILYVLNISKDQKELRRIRSRLIGTYGKVRKRIEEITNTKISVFGKTVSIIGKDDDLERARLALEKIIEGKTHSMVFKFLEAKDKN